MATATANKTAAQKKAAAAKAAAAKAKAAQAAAEVDEVEDDDETTPAANEVVFGVADLAKLLSEGREKPVTTRELRTLIRKMARDGKGRVQREIIAGNRSRYSWSGPKDPEVVAIIKAFNDGELEADKQEKLQALKDRKAAQRAEAAKAAEKTTKKTKKAKAVEVDEDDDEELELDDDE